jgi:Zn-dependent protease
MQEISPIFYIVVLIFSVIIHEVAHGYAALSYGDHTAEMQGRLTLNPIKHIDLYGSIILPLLFVVTHAPFMIGWAKPVPYNPDNFTPAKRRIATLWVASAGILSNLAIAVFFSIIIRLSNYVSFIPESIIPIASVIVILNIVLAIFNLVPIPPLDGSKILFSAIGYKSFKLERRLGNYSLIILLFFVFFLWQFVSPVILWLFSIMTGLA